MKKLLIVLLGMLPACAGRPSPEVPTQLTKEIFEAFNSHDWEKMVSYYAEKVEYVSPDGRFETKAEVLAYYKGMHQAFPDIHDEIVSLYPSGNSVVVEFIATATTPDGGRMHLPILGVLTFENGKVVRDVTYFDL